MHHTNFIRNDDVSICACQNIFDCISRRNFAENETFRCDFKITSFSNDICDALIACQRQCTFLKNLGLTVLLAVISCNDNLLDTGTEIHGAAHTGHLLAGDNPVGQGALLVYLQAAQNGGVYMAAADKAEGGGGVDVAAKGSGLGGCPPASVL